jgi:GDP-D-mannose dehydratase
MNRLKDVPYLKGNSEKIRQEFGWKPEYTWKDVALEMLEADFTRFHKSKL